MSDKELIALIHGTVSDTINESLEQFQPLISSFVSTSNPLTEEELKNQTKSVLKYTMLVSEVSCIAMSKTLAALGILTTLSTDT